MNELGRQQQEQSAAAAATPAPPPRQTAIATSYGALVWYNDANGIPGFSY